MKLLHSKVIQHLTTAYYNSLYLTSGLVRLYITGLIVVAVAIAGVALFTPSVLSDIPASGLLWLPVEHIWMVGDGTFHKPSGPALSSEPVFDGS